jgi:hypothetical protein
MNFQESCTALLEADPKLAALYYKCVTSDYEANMADVKLVLSSAPEDFDKEHLKNLYFLAENRISDPDSSLEMLNDIKAYIDLGDIKLEDIITQFSPSFTRDLNIELFGIDLGDNKNFLAQYSQSILFGDKIRDRRELLLANIKAQDGKIDKLQQPKIKELEQNQKNFTSSTQNSHDPDVEKASLNSFKRLESRYGYINTSNAMSEVEAYIATLSTKQLTAKNKQNALC